MLKILKNVALYAPEYQGIKDVLICDTRIAHIADCIETPTGLGEVEVFDYSGLKAMPGFIDGHVHMLGGGGEGGPATRTPELMLTTATRAGVTTVVGCLGTDGTTRHMESLIIKARALEEEGLTTFIYTGAYEIPTPTLTGCVRDDLILMDKVIGVGEIALSDHRSAQPTHTDLAKLAAETRVGGMLGGKPGIVHFHVGGGPEGINAIFWMLDHTEIPVTQFLPTHMGRNQALLDQGLALIKKGGHIDITAGSKVPGQIMYLLNKGATLDSITISSDGQGSLPKFNEKGQLIGLKVGQMKRVYEVWRTLIQKHQVDISEALKLVTANPAKNLKLSNTKGAIKPGADADIVIMDDQLNIQELFARGRHMLSHGEPIVKGTFE